MDTRQTEHLSEAQRQALGSLLAVEKSLASILRSIVPENVSRQIEEDLSKVLDRAILATIRHPKR